MIWAVFAGHLLARLAYVGYVWISLVRQQSDSWWTRRWGLAGGFRRFRRGASIVMAVDAITFIAVSVVGWGTLPTLVPRAAAIAAGAVLVFVGLGTKLWAAATLGGQAYYWYNFFASGATTTRAKTGPYRYLKNPMYTVGYLQTYGLALVTGSLAGLIAAVCDQVGILVFLWRVESTHFERVSRIPA